MIKYHCQLLIWKWKWEKMQDDWWFCDYIYNKTISAILLTHKNDTWGGVLLRDQLLRSAISHGSRHTTEQCGMKSLALPLLHYYWLLMYMWTNVKNQMYLCGRRELQHIECTRRYCDATLSDSPHAPEVIFDRSICPFRRPG